MSDREDGEIVTCMAMMLEMQTILRTTASRVVGMYVFVCLCVYVIYTTYSPNVVDLVGFPLLMAQLVTVHLTLYQR